jgi:hypothetical protein
VVELYQWNGSAQGGLDRLHQAGIDYVVYGPEERSFGSPTWLTQVSLILRVGSIELYEVARK